MFEPQASQSVTFEELSRALARLGFERHATSEFTLFRNAEVGAVIILPREDTSSDVRPIHLAAARATVAGKGIAAPADFDRLLVQDAGTAVPKGKAKKARLQAA